MTFTYSRWQRRERYAYASLASIVFAVALSVTARSIVPLALIAISVPFTVRVWYWRWRNTPRTVEVHRLKILLSRGDASTPETWLTNDIRLVDVRPGDLARPLSRVATIVGHGGRVAYLDAQVSAGEAALVAALRAVGLTVRWDVEVAERASQDPIDIGDELIRWWKRSRR